MRDFAGSILYGDAFLGWTEVDPADEEDAKKRIAELEAEEETEKQRIESVLSANGLYSFTSAEDGDGGVKSERLDEIEAELSRQYDRLRGKPILDPNKKQSSWFDMLDRNDTPFLNFYKKVTIGDPPSQKMEWGWGDLPTTPDSEAVEQ